MAETDGCPGATPPAELLQQLLQVLGREREAILSLDEGVLAETEKDSRRLLEALPSSVCPEALTAADYAGLTALFKEAHRQRDYNLQLLKAAASALESELSQLPRQKKNLRAYLLTGPAAEDPAEALFLYRKC